MTIAPETVLLFRGGSTPWGTFGRLLLPCGAHFATLERPWAKNRRGESCIPSGIYGLKLRASPIVSRTSGGKFARGYEVVNVPARSLIMIHPGNWMADSNGCILVGRQIAIIDGRPGIADSRAAFSDLMARLNAREQWQISIEWEIPERR